MLFKLPWASAVEPDRFQENYSCKRPLYSQRVRGHFFLRRYTRFGAFGIGRTSCKRSRSAINNYSFSKFSVITDAASQGRNVCFASQSSERYDARIHHFTL